MPFRVSVLNTLHHFLDPNSIRMRLTLGVVLASAIGIGGVAGWMGWRMQQILLESHKRKTETIAERFDQDVELYQGIMPTQAALEKVIDYRTTADMALWIKLPNGQVIAQSDILEMGSWQETGVTQQLLSLTQATGTSTYHLQDRYLVICSSPLRLDNSLLGTLYVADEITQDQLSFLTLSRNLALTSGVMIVVLAVWIALYVQRSLAPICQLNQLATSVSADNLAQTHLTLRQAPTEVKELSQSFDRMLGRLAIAWEQQRRFLSDVSHELRTPLTLVQGYLQSTLRRCQTLSDSQREGLEIAAAEADRTIQVLQDLLDWARLNSGQRHITLEAFDLKAVLLEVAILTPTYQERIIVDIETAPVIVQADRQCLKQVLIHLIDNAIRYSEPKQPVILRLQQQANWAIIQVCDRGRGIPEADQPHIFDPFYRVDVDRSRATGGTGLGLSIVKQLVETMQGHIVVSSTLGEGSVFSVSLPA
ncbi:two-component sensor histidine kinase [Halomicronema hongdechloris C2206]|uniref:histidine kinase n=1 Tax=Halomicronema hongdechloris C2206 TaxID=1641165 RepID=A0A1Z3HGE1_9CYAN|nr:HAMP domain-containing sensor histidine kinase [Halomicronema hongdechloris]ASC69335.1 two-component sensor histidine kinase [Halomicronema hongdechloris C2206]